MTPRAVDRDPDNNHTRAARTQTELDANNDAGDEHAGTALFAGRRGAIPEIPAPSTLEGHGRRDLEVHSIGVSQGEIHLAGTALSTARRRATP